MQLSCNPLSLAQQLLELLLQRLEPLARFTKLALGSEPLIFRQIARGFRDEGVHIG